MTKRYAIVGGRDFPDLGIVREFVRKLPKGTTIISGAARGVDKCAADEAKRCGLSVEEIPVTPEEWAKFGKAAGHMRNSKIVAANLDGIIAFWDGASKGTKNCIEQARAKGIPVRVFGLP